MPKISVLMGVYNNADTLRESMESVLSQTFADFEFIIYDDASSDGSLEIIKSYGETDGRIRVLHGDVNRGLAYALNRCLEAARGEYCARMDGDDLCDPTRFEKQSAFLDGHPEYGFVSTTMKRFDENGVYSVPPTGSGYSPDVRAFVSGSPFCHAPVMIRRSAYEAVEGYRDIEKTRGVEDYDLWFRLYAAGIRGYIIQEPLYSMFDGRGAAHRRTMRRRINEAWVRKQGYAALGVPLPLRIYILKPVLLGLIPQWLYRLMRKV
ncbi:MAG: glycosyltransferase [Candidatus Avispirillum sp.]